MLGSAPISKELREEYEAKLMEVLDEEDHVAEKKKQISDALGGELKLVRSEKARIRRVLKNQESPQMEISGTEVGERRRSPIVEGLLKAADGLKQVKKLRGKIAKAAREGAEKRASALDWKMEKEGTDVAEVPGGRYEIHFDTYRHSVRWIPEKGKEQFLGAHQSRADAERQAESHCAERAGDAILKNAGDGKLTDKSLKGEPVKRKGKRRG